MEYKYNKGNSFNFTHTRTKPYEIDLNKVETFEDFKLIMMTFNFRFVSHLTDEEAKSISKFLK